MCGKVLRHAGLTVDCCLALPGDYTHDLCRPPTTHTRLFCFPIFPPQSESVLRTIALRSELLDPFPKASLLPQGFRLDRRWTDHHIHHIAADFDHSRSGYLSSIPIPLALSSSESWGCSNRRTCFRPAVHS